MRSIDETEAHYPAVKVYRSSFSGFFAVGFFSIFVNLGTLVSPIYMQQIFDRVLQSSHLETLVFLTVIVFFFLAIIAILDAIRGSILASVARWWDESVHADLLAAIVQHSRAKGSSHAHAVNDLATIRQFVGSPSVLPFFDGPWMPLFMLAVTLIHPWLGLVAVGAAVLLLLLAGINDRITRHKMKGLAEHRSRAQSTVDVAARHSESVYSMGMLPGVLTRFREDNSKVAQAMYDVASSSAKIGALTKFVRFSAQISILGLGAYLATNGQISAGSMIAASIIMGRALAPAEQALGAWRSLVGAMQAHNRITNLLRMAPVAPPRIQQPKVHGKLDLKSASYALPGRERPILRALDLQIEAGTLIGLVGPSGSGKSTLCRLLIGALEPTSGSVRLDGVAMKNWSQQQLGQNVGYLAQSVELMEGSIRENIARLSEPDDTAVIQAARLAGCHELINSLPEGYETQIGIGRSTLSGGQAQRIGFARAIYKLPKLIVLDEPNANLDAEGENALQDCIFKLRSLGSTVIVVSHRPAALAKADLIVTLGMGQILQKQSGEEYLRRTIRPVGDALKKLGKLKPSTTSANEKSAAAPRSWHGGANG
ncbi:type I secretion system permease/ATPase [Polycladidibacter hongkongensis]|uniref:type I secretion system permease/ATPase n=1 Tax=Polycladidibacter hongkongensis TaxID=1647556 RepID=UPI000834A363|nr:type I secretion system permease/ATPase [Pseudovibrio hongkongensis]